MVSAGSLSTAAERLRLNQSTVSARIRSLEQQLGASLLVRNKAGSRLTAAGRQFQAHAAVLVRTVEKARQELGVPLGFRASLTVGARFALWQDLLTGWLPRMRERAPDVSVRAEIGFEQDLMQGLVDGSIDIALMYTPEARPGLVTEYLFDEALEMVATRADAAPRPGADYVHVDWGADFHARMATHWPDYGPPPLSVAVGWLGVQHLLDNGGTAYLPERLVREELEAGRLHRVRGAQGFRLPAWMVFAESRDRAVADPALDLVRELVAGRV